MKRFAIIGCGRIAKKHAVNIARIGTLVATCDLVEQQADDLASEYNATAYYTIDDLLTAEKGLDVIAVCTPNGFHAEHIIKSLQAGVNVLTEKPMCLTKAAAWQIIETEKFCRKKLFVVKSSRYNDILKQVKNLIDTNALGKLYSFNLSCVWNRTDSYYTDWRGKIFPDGGTLYTQFSHYIDSMLWLFGDVADVKGFKTNCAHQKSIEFEDTGAAALQMENGILGSLHWTVNAFQKNFEIGLTIIAEKGTIKLGGEYLQQLIYAETENAISEFLNNETGSEADKTSLTNHDKIYTHLAQVLEANEGSFPGAHDGLKTVETIEKIYKAVS
jgi:UDP-N-acetyl-2-amino-2-deoxyglucuronate dehydrogenase